MPEPLDYAGVRYVHDEDGAVWPVPWGDAEHNGVEWRLRYGPHPDYFAASCVAAYASLLDPNRPLGDAIAMLRRARRCVKDAPDA